MRQDPDKERTRNDIAAWSRAPPVGTGASQATQQLSSSANAALRLPISDEGLGTHTRPWSLLAACLTGLATLAALLSSVAGIETLKSMLPDSSAMPPWLAMGMLLSALALGLATSSSSLARVVSTASAMAVATTVGLPLLDIAPNHEIRADFLLFPHALPTMQSHVFAFPSRIGLYTACGFVALATALILAPHTGRHRAWRAAFSTLATVAVLPAAIGTLGYLTGLWPLLDISPNGSTGLLAAIGLATLAAGTLALRPDIGWIGFAAAHGWGSWATCVLLGAAGLMLALGLGVGLSERAEAIHAARIPPALEAVMSTLKDAETGQRGYQLTGDERYLEPYEAALTRLPVALGALTAVMGQGAPRLRLLADEKSAEMAAAVLLHRSGDAAAARALVRKGDGKSVMDALRAETAALSVAAFAKVSANEIRASRAGLLVAIGAVGLASLALHALVIAERLRRATADSRAAVARVLAASAALQSELLATLDLGAAMTSTLDGRIRLWSRGCQELYGWTAEEAVGRVAWDLLRTVSPVSQVEIETALECDGAWQGELRNRTRSGQELVVATRMVLRRSEDGPPVVLKSFADITAQKTAETALRRSETHFLRAVAAIGIGTSDWRVGEGAIQHSPGYEALFGLAEGEMMDSRAFLRVVHPEDQARVEARYDSVLRDLGADSYDEEYRILLPDGGQRWLHAQAALWRGADACVTGMSGAIQDITQLHQEQAQRATLAQEVDHRAKNVLAVVLSLLRLSPRDGDCETFVKVAEGRINAMARAHSLLASKRWQGVDLGALLRDELEAQSGRVAFSGPAVQLGPIAAQPMAMALHELATNAAKHGALSRPDGRVQITWEMDKTSGGLLLRWEEFGGPPIAAPPVRRGFGSRLLESMLRRQLSGSLIQEWNAAGMRAQLILPARYAVLAPVINQATTQVVQVSAPPNALSQQKVQSAGPLKRVLLVGDGMLLALELEKTIRELGYVVVGPARSLVEAVALASSEPDLAAAVLDVNLGGGERVFPIVDILVTRDVPFLFVTGYGSSNSLEGYEKAALAVLPKPYDHHALATAIQAAIICKRAVSTKSRRL